MSARMHFMRPMLPDMQEVQKRFSLSVEQNVLTNFGPNWHEAKRRLTQLTGRAAVPCASGTAAVTLACIQQFRSRLEIQPPRVGVPDFAPGCTIAAVAAAGCEPVIIRCDPETLVMCSVAAARNVPRFNLDGLVVVAPFGFAFNPEPWNCFAEANGVGIVFDLAGAWPQLPATNFPVCYSTHATKNMTTLEGGFVLLADEAQAERVRRLSVFSYTADRACQDTMGFNGKLDEWRSAMLCEQLSDPANVAHRVRDKRALYRAYADADPRLHAFPSGLHELATPSLLAFHVPMAGVFVSRLARAGIPAHRYYHPLLGLQDLQVKREVPLHRPYDRTLLSNIVALPSELTPQEFKTVLRAVRAAFE